MKYREVGNTGVRISEIGFGGGGNAGLMVRGSDEEQRNAIGRALELGINYFDVAPHDGDGLSEANFGKAFKALGVRPYITTKVEVHNQELDDIAGHVARSLDESLERLGVDYVDFLLIHNGPDMTRPELKGMSYLSLWVEDYLKPGGALEGLQRVQKAGKTRFIGFITRGNDAPAARKLIDTGCISLMNTHVSLLNPSAAMAPFGMRADRDYGGILNYAAEHGVGVAIYSPLGNGLLTNNSVAGGEYHPLARGPLNPASYEGDLRRAKTFSFLSQPGEHSVEAAAIRFVLSLPSVTVALGGFSDQRQVEGTAGCSGLGPLSEENMTRIEAIWRGNFGQST